MGEPEQKKGVRIICISDTHTHHGKLTIPDGDILIHGGDFTNFGKLNDITEFNTWLGTLPHKTKIVVAGNHESGGMKLNPLRPLLTNATFLDQEAITVDGLKIFGTKFFWPCPDGNPYYDQIPLDTQVLISHGPPKGYFDSGSGCPALLEKVKQIKPLLHIFGRIRNNNYIHSGYGTGRGEGEFSQTIFVNAAMVVGEEKKLSGKPIVIDL